MFFAADERRMLRLFERQAAAAAEAQSTHLLAHEKCGWPPSSKFGKTKTFLCFSLGKGREVSPPINAEHSCAAAAAVRCLVRELSSPRDDGQMDTRDELGHTLRLKYCRRKIAPPSFCFARLPKEPAEEKSENRRHSVLRIKE